MVLVLPFAALLGLAIGSFLNVVAWRMPRRESLVRPGSRCPGCGTAIGALDNVPVVSWLALHGRCRSCGERISARYPLVELATAALYVAVVAAAWDDAARIALGIALVTLLVPVTLIDLEHRIIPNRLTGPFAVLAIGLGAALDPGFVPEQVIAGVAAGGFFMLAVLAYPRGMGMGDVKLAGVLGLYLGRAVGPALLVGLVAGVVVGAAIMARKGAAAGRKTAIPFGPFLALGGIVAIFVGDTLVDAYLDRF
jgi:leader peptidase (prepilin peptidase) / N-methyltransferase